MEILIKIVVWAVSIVGLSYIGFRTMMSMVNNKTERGIISVDGVEIEKDKLPSAGADQLSKGLNIYPGVNGESELVSKNPDDLVIDESLDKLEWEDITVVTLVFEENHFIEVSGSLHEGFCAIYLKDDNRLFAEPPPGSIPEMKDILKNFMIDKDVSVKKYKFS